MKRLLVILAAAAALLASCGIGNPWPTNPPMTGASSAHHELLMVGDSLLGQTDYALAGVLNAHGLDVTVIDAHINGAGLIGPVPYTAPDGTITVYADALAWVQHQLELHPDVDTVVLEYAGACATCDLWLPTSVAYGSDAFYDRWLAAADAIIDWLHGQGKVVLWAKSPQSGASGDAIASGAQFRVAVGVWLSAFDELLLAPRAGTPAPDWWAALNDVNGAFDLLLWYDGAVHGVRSPDLVHLKEDGAVRTATWTVSALRTVWDQLPPPVNALEQPQGSSLVEAGDPVTINR